MPAGLAPHASPTYQDVEFSQPKSVPDQFSIDTGSLQLTETNYDEDGASPPHSLVSPAFTPPSTPGTQTPRIGQRKKSIPVDSLTRTGTGPGLKLLDVLPEVECVVRARIPTTAGQEMFLHLYTNNIDKKEHLAIVFGPHIRSRSLDRVRPGETEMDRMIRGAYTGRLYPGRTTSKVEDDEAVVKPPLEPSSSSLNLDKSNASWDSINPALPHSSPPNNPVRDSARMATARAQFQPHPTIHDQPSSRSPTLPERDPPQPLQADATPSAPLVRIHSECYTGETVWSARCDCGEQLDEAARLMSLPSADSTPGTPGTPGGSPSLSALAADAARNPGGVIIYLRQEGRGIGLSEKLKAYNLQDLGNDTVEANLLLRHPADKRSYGLATAMLVDLGLGGPTGIRLMTNNPDKIRAVEGPNREVRVRERVPMVPLAWKTGGREGIRSAEVESYLRTKIEQFGHMIGGDT